MSNYLKPAVNTLIYQAVARRSREIIPRDVMQGSNPPLVAQGFSPDTTDFEPQTVYCNDSVPAHGRGQDQNRSWLALQQSLAPRNANGQRGSSASPNRDEPWMTGSGALARHKKQPCLRWGLVEEKSGGGREGNTSLVLAWCRQRQSPRAASLHMQMTRAADGQWQSDLEAGSARLRLRGRGLIIIVVMGREMGLMTGLAWGRSFFNLECLQMGCALSRAGAHDIGGRRRKHQKCSFTWEGLLRQVMASIRNLQTRPFQKARVVDHLGRAVASKVRVISDATGSQKLAGWAGRRMTSPRSAPPDRIRRGRR